MRHDQSKLNKVWFNKQKPWIFQDVLADQIQDELSSHPLVYDLVILVYSTGSLDIYEAFIIKLIRFFLDYINAETFQYLPATSRPLYGENRKVCCEE